MNVRDRAIANLGGVCRSCFTKDNLQLHHVAYLPLSTRNNEKSDYWKRAREALEHPERFQLLCKRCHEARHHKKDYIKDPMFRSGPHMTLASLLIAEKQPTEICPYCHEVFEEGGKFGRHIYWCKKNHLMKISLSA